MTALLTRKEAAVRLRYRSEEALRKLIRRDARVRARFCKIGGRVLISEANLEALIAESSVTTSSKPVRTRKPSPSRSEVVRRLRQIPREVMA